MSKKVNYLSFYCSFIVFSRPICPDLTNSPFIIVPSKQGSIICALQKILEREGKKMVRINLLPERAEAEIWQRLEKAIWIFWFSLPFAFILWVKFVMNSK
jgi:hypothetical protein